MVGCVGSNSILKTRALADESGRYWITTYLFRYEFLRLLSATRVCITVHATVSACSLVTLCSDLSLVSSITHRHSCVYNAPFRWIRSNVFRITFGGSFYRLVFLKILEKESTPRVSSHFDEYFIYTFPTISSGGDKKMMRAVGFCQRKWKEMWYKKRGSLRFYRRDVRLQNTRAINWNVILTRPRTAYILRDEQRLIVNNGNKKEIIPAFVEL